MVAQTEVSGEVSVVNVAHLLRVASARAYKYIKVKEGDDVKMKTVIASKGLTAAGRLKSPVNGFVYRIDKSTGRVLIKVVGQPYELTAYLAGTVANVIAGRGVVIETTGALIQAALGFGGEAYGVLQVVSKRATDAMKVRAIDVTMHGAIVVGGAWFDEAVLQQAIQMQVRGLIVGSMEGSLLRAARRAPFPILLTEGLGHVAMAAPIFRLLKSNAGREVSISGVTRVRWGVQRPEILIPLPSESKSEPPAFGTPLSDRCAGARVARFIAGPGWPGDGAARSAAADGEWRAGALRRSRFGRRRRAHLDPVCESGNLSVAGSFCFLIRFCIQW